MYKANISHTQRRVNCSRTVSTKVYPHKSLLKKEPSKAVVCLSQFFSFIQDHIWKIVFSGAMLFIYAILSAAYSFAQAMVR